MIVKGAGWVVAAALALTAGPALAKDKLPLKIGLYVDQSVPCKDAPQSAKASYGGGDGGIDIPPYTCKFVKLTKSGSTYVLRQSCYDAQSDATVPDFNMSFKAPDAKTIIINGTKFRYCGKA